MKIKTKLWLNANLSISLILFIGLVLILTSQKANDPRFEDSKTKQITQEIIDLNLTTHHFLLHKDVRAQSHWLLKHDSLTEFIKNELNQGVYEKETLERMGKNIKDVKTFISDLVTSFENHQKQRHTLFNEREERLIKQLLSTLKLIIDDSYQLNAWRQADVFSSQRKTTLIILVLIIIGTAFIIANSILFSSRILKPFTNLQEGMQIIGDGNLDYKLKILAEDEVGGLSKSFNQMSDKLKIQQNQFQSAKLEVEEIAQSQERASRHKTNYLSNVSHELRTPLNSLLLLTYSLIENKEQNLTEHQKKLLQTIYSSGTELFELIRDVLDLSKIESGKVIYEMNKFPLYRLIDDIKDKFQKLFDKKRITLKTELLEGLPEWIQTDQQKVKQIIKNLLSNALKFTTQGSVTVRVRRPGLNEDLFNDLLDPVNSIVIEVSDTGSGISKQHHDMIFEAFQQGRSECQNEGTGLGLCISKELAESLGGSIGLQSELGKGSTFSIYLPEKFEIDELRIKKDNKCLPKNIEINNKDKDKEAPFDVQLNLQSKTILLVDDDARNVYALFSVLKKHGCTVVSAFDGQDALHYLNDLPNIDLVLMDIMMPIMDGYECIRAIRKQELFKDLPIIALTAKALKADQEKCLQVGASDYLSKPAIPSRLFPLLNKWLC